MAKGHEGGNVITVLLYNDIISIVNQLYCIQLSLIYLINDNSDNSSVKGNFCSFSSRLLLFRNYALYLTKFVGRKNLTKIMDKDESK